MLAQRLVKAALELHRKQLWREFAEEDALVLDIPGRDSPIAACFCGHHGQEFGLTLFPDGLEGVDRFFTGGESDQLALLVSPLREVPPALRGLLEEARWGVRREAPAPHLIVNRAGRKPRNPRKGEIRTALYAASAVLAAHGELPARHYASADGVPRLRLSGPPHNPSYEVGTTVFERPERERTPVSLPPGACRETGGAWSIGLVDPGARIEGDDRAAGVLLVADRETGRVLHHDVIMGNDPDRAAAVVADFASRNSELPAEVHVLDRELAERLEPALREFGVVCRHEPDQPALGRIAADLSGSFPEFDESPAMKAAAARYRQHHDAFDAAMTEVAKRHRGNPDRELARYFGSARRGRELIEACREPEHLLAPYMGWMLALYRARENSPTVLERTLRRRDLPPEQRAVGEAMRAARPSLYRVESIDPPRLELMDIVAGNTLTIRDVGMSHTAVPGLILPAIVYPAEGFLTISMIGPHLPPGGASRAFDFLESQGIPVSEEGLAQNPHFGGRLADWLARESDQPRVLQNTEGDPIVIHTAGFVADDPGAAAATLDADPAMEFDEEDGCYVWYGDEHFAGGELVLGRIEFVDGRLLLECNSERRFEQGRAMLEEIPGVRFERVRTRPMSLESLVDDPARGAAEDDFDDEDPEDASQVVALMTEYLMRWLDMEIPAFEGRTPREECATADGQRRVRLEILTMPTPHPAMAGEPMQRVRARMLEDLGLDG